MLKRGKLTKRINLTAAFNPESLSGVILIACVVLSLLIANSPLGKYFEAFLAETFGLGHLQLSVLSWVNDGLMAIFFFLIGLEIKQEMIDGHLSSFKKASVPVFAAIGGALIPAFIYVLLNKGTSTAAGWGIPMATDIAFALAVLSLLGKLVPPSLKAFLSTLAVVDDLLAIVVIAIFYSDGLSWHNLMLASGIFLLLLVMNKLGVKQVLFYIIPGMVMWYFVHHSGVHATIAGVLTAIAIPYRSKKGSPLKELAHKLVVPVNYIIMPVFALANTNIHFDATMFSGIVSPLGIGIIIGLILGKPVGVMLASWLSVTLKIGTLPHKVSWQLIAGVGVLAGIGFTMSIFISFLSFGDSIHNTEAKLSILIASILAGALGYAYLKRSLKTRI